MLCEDCDHFLEIAEAIRSLGLTILKGMTDNHGDKTWVRFVVEVNSEPKPVTANICHAYRGRGVKIILQTMFLVNADISRLSWPILRSW